MTRLGDGSVLTKLCSESKQFRNRMLRMAKMMKSNCNFYHILLAQSVSEHCPLRGSRRTETSQFLVKWCKCKDQDAKRYLTQTMKDSLFKEKIPLAQSRRINKCQMKNEWNNRREEPKPRKTLGFLIFLGGEKQHDVFKDLERPRAKIQTNK